MRRSRVAPATLQLSLFPFLAVLICTMGVLIVLLVIVTRAANVHAQSARDEALEGQNEQLEQLRDVTQLEQVRAELLSQMQPALIERLEEARLNRSHYEDQIQKLRLEAESLNAELAALDGDHSQESRQQQVQQLSKLQQELEEAERELAEELERTQERLSSYAVVPYPGPNGTTRRPIYLECTREGIWLRPYGILLTDAELHPPVLAGNPLDSSLLAIREYWQRYGDQDSEPYPLIIVRPDGADAYAMVRTAIKSWDSEFGYELVDQETPLVFPGEDPELAKHLQEIVASSVQKHEQLQAAVLRQQQAIRMSGANVSRGQGGGNGLANRSRGNGSQTGGFNGSGDGQGDGGSGVVLRASRRSGGFVVEQTGNDSSDWGNRGFGTNDGDPLALAHGNSSSSLLGDETSSSMQAGNQFGTGTATGNGQGNGSPSRYASGSSSNAGSASGNQQGGSSSRGGSSSGNSNPFASFSRDEGSQPEGGTSQLTPAQQMAMAKATQEASEQAATANEFLRQLDPQLAVQAVKFAQGRGRDWALTSKTPTATAYRKPIQIVCGADRVTILPGSYSAEPTRSVTFSRGTKEQIDEFVDGVWRLVDSWGFPGYNAYWKPELHVTVEEGGEERFRELKAYLITSGIDVKRR